MRYGILLTTLMLATIPAMSQDKPDVIEPSFPVNFSCGQTALHDNQGNVTGWLLVGDITSHRDDVDVVTTHIQIRYSLGDDAKMDAKCLSLHKAFVAARAKERHSGRYVEDQRTRSKSAVEPTKLEKAAQ